VGLLRPPLAYRSFLSGRIGTALPTWSPTIPMARQEAGHRG
jgi:hypothetical protein